MFLSPVPGSPAEEQPPPAADFYPQAKLGFGGLSMDDEGDARMSSPLATRPLKRNKLATPRDKGTPASRASTATDGVDSDASAGAASDDDDECGGFSLRVPRDGGAGPARSLFGRREGGPGREARDAPPPANVNPFAPRDLNRCDSIDTNSGSWTFDGGLKPALAAPAAPRRGAAGARRDAAADASSRFRNDFEVVREIGAGSFGTVRKVRSRIDGCLYAVKSTHARPRARRRKRGAARTFERPRRRSSAASCTATGRSRRSSRWPPSPRATRAPRACGTSCATTKPGSRTSGCTFRRSCATRRWRAASAAAASCRRPRRSGASSGRCSSRSSCSTRAVWSTSTSSRATSSSRARTRAEVVLPRSRPPGGERARGARLGRRACHAGEDCYKLGDFGLATTARARGDVVEGDARYMSKELLDDDDFMSGGGSGPRDLTKCDVFSLGATAFELVRRAPLAANGPAWHALRDGAAAFPATVPRDLRDVIAGLVHPNPAWRPTPAAALQHPELQSEVQRMALQLAAEKQHVQQYREDVARLSKHRLARSNTWA